MIQYFDDGDLACFDGLSFRKDKRTGYYLNAKTHKRLHVYVWEYYNGVIPKGYQVHHVDLDKSNNEIENLALLSAKEHAKLHGSFLTDEQKAKMAENLLKNAIPKAAEWHGSEAGKAWHKAHYEQMKDRLHEKKIFTCENCGKQFEAVNNGQNHYCSNNCKSAARRKSGIDNEKRKCVICGNEFEANKYSSKMCCSRSCMYEMKRRNKNASKSKEN